MVICEASGGYERHVLNTSAAAGVPVHRAHGTRTRNFARYLGLGAKTVAVGARMLALFATKSENLRLWQPPSTEKVELRALRRRRDDLAKMIRIEQNRLEHPQTNTVELPVSVPSSPILLPNTGIESALPPSIKHEFFKKNRLKVRFHRATHERTLCKIRKGIERSDI